MIQTNNLKAKYQTFLREYVDKKWLQQFKNAVVLGERLIAGYYIVIFETPELIEIDLGGLYE